MSIKDRLKLKIKQDMTKEVEKSGRGGTDGRFLNYFDLKFEEKIKILFVPSKDGDFWIKYHKHGPNLDIRGIDSIDCPWKTSGDDCPACQRGFDLIEEAKEVGGKDTPEGKALYDEAKQWFAKDYTLTQCIVLESPIDINQDKEGNQVKLFGLPYAVEAQITEDIKEGKISSDDLCTYPFVIKKTKNQGGQASYQHSYFDLRNPITDEDLEAFDDLVVEPFSADDIRDIIPAPATTEDVEEWLVKVDEKLSKKKSSNETQQTDNVSTTDSKQRTSYEKAAETVSKNNKADLDEDVNLSASKEEPEQQPEPEQEEKKAKTSVSALRERLNRAK